VNLEIGVQRVGLNLGQCGLGVAHRARVTWIKHRVSHGRHIMNAHLLSFRSTLVRCSLEAPDKSAVEVELKARCLAVTADPADSPKTRQRELCRIAHVAGQSTGFCANGNTFAVLV
jgi:hypothetical protein